MGGFPSDRMPGRARAATCYRSAPLSPAATSGQLFDSAQTVPAYKVFSRAVPDNRFHYQYVAVQMAGFPELTRAGNRRREAADAANRFGSRPTTLPASAAAGRCFRASALRSDAGEALVVTGPNGAGKSSLLRLVAGPGRDRRRPAGGGGRRGRCLGRRAGALSRPPGRTQTGADGGGEPRFLVALFPGGRRTEAALAAVGLDRIASLPAAYLSAGQRRRLSIARLIAVERPIWLLDEPTSALDAAAQAMLAELMRDHLRRRDHRCGDTRPDRDGWCEGAAAGGGWMIAASQSRKG